MQSCTPDLGRISSSTRKSHFALICIFETLTSVSVCQRRFGFDFPNEKAAVLGNGDAPISFTGRPDVARFIGFVFTNLPVEKLEWKILRLEGERTVGAIPVLVFLLITEPFESS